MNEQSPVSLPKLAEMSWQEAVLLQQSVVFLANSLRQPTRRDDPDAVLAVASRILGSPLNPNAIVNPVSVLEAPVGRPIQSTSLFQGIRDTLGPQELLGSIGSCVSVRVPVNGIIPLLQNGVLEIARREQIAIDGMTKAGAPGSEHTKLAKSTADALAALRFSVSAPPDPRAFEWEIVPVVPVGDWGAVANWMGK